MRSFVAIDFSKQLKNRIAELQRELRSHAVTGRWKYIDNFHLTLKFLNEIDDSTTDLLDEELKRISSAAGNFKLNISGMGYFPGNNCLRVIWLGLAGDLYSLRSLQSKIYLNFKRHGFEPEKRDYTPHVTIGQDVVLRGNFEDLIKKIDFNSFPEIAVDKIYLYKSEQITNKRVYTPIREYVLKGESV